MIKTKTCRACGRTGEDFFEIKNVHGFTITEVVGSLWGSDSEASCALFSCPRCGTIVCDYWKIGDEA